MVIDGENDREQLLEVLGKKQQAWLEAMNAAKYKAESLDSIMRNLQTSQTAKRIREMTKEERAWLLVKMVCTEDIRTQKVLSEALWV